MLSDAGRRARQAAPFDIEEVLKGVEQGRRNDAIFRLASSYRGRDFRLDQAMKVTLEVARKCRPPLHEDEARRTVERGRILAILDTPATICSN